MNMSRGQDHMLGAGGEGQTGLGPRGGSQVNKFEQVHSGHMCTPLPRLCEQTDTLEHYLPAAYLAGGNDGSAPAEGRDGSPWEGRKDLH